MNILFSICTLFLFSYSYNMERDHLSAESPSTNFSLPLTPIYTGFPETSTDISNTVITQASASQENNDVQSFDGYIKSLVVANCQEYVDTILKPQLQAIINQHMEQINSTFQSDLQNKPSIKESLLQPFSITCNQANCSKIFFGENEKTISQKYKTHYVGKHLSSEIKERAKQVKISQNAETLSLQCQECDYVLTSQKNETNLRKNYLRHLARMHNILPDNLQTFIDSNMIKPTNPKNLIKKFICPECNDQIVSRSLGNDTFYKHLQKHNKSFGIKALRDRITIIQEADIKKRKTPPCEEEE